MLLCQTHRCEHLYFCFGVTLQIHHQTASWRQNLYATVSSFFSTVFHELSPYIETTAVKTEQTSMELELMDVEQQLVFLKLPQRRKERGCRRRWSLRQPPRRRSRKCDATKPTNRSSCSLHWYCSLCIVIFFGRWSSGYGKGSTQKHKLAFSDTNWVSVCL